MTGILIFILFMLNIFLIFAVVLLYQRQNRFKEMEENQRKIQQESEEMLSAFLFELKEENQSFISKFQQDKMQTNQVNIQNEESREIVKQEEPLTAETYSRMLASEAYQNSNKKMSVQEDIEKTFAEQVEMLAQQGLSSSEIARQLKKGKTEVELLLKFHKNHR
ncbi:DUF6115 domain-containing protein [Lederbergia citri]|uniref:Coupling factor for flagellin transcription and translation n=1 Tax=Lederbergia citri TaxID=2833580 RepID=A0A942TA90_9BACI|nr:hypothetical protein [Lederbergia citri]MBS4194010.1 hypothetical protein [Lederbergia citri]